jgi:hypothetical protein
MFFPIARRLAAGLGPAKHTVLPVCTSPLRARRYASPAPFPYNEEEKDPQLGDYPALPNVSRQYLPAKGWYDQQLRRNFGETVSCLSSTSWWRSAQKTHSRTSCMRRMSCTPCGDQTSLPCPLRRRCAISSSPPSPSSRLASSSMPSSSPNCRPSDASTLLRAS